MNDIRKEEGSKTWLHEFLTSGGRGPHVDAYSVVAMVANGPDGEHPVVRFVLGDMHRNTTADLIMDIKEACEVRDMVQRAIDSAKGIARELDSRSSRERITIN